MRIGLDARYTSDHFPGIGRYIVGLARGLAELQLGHTLLLLVERGKAGGRYDLEALGHLPGVELVPVTAGPFGPAQHVTLPLLARRLQLDLLHSPYYVRPYLGLPCPSVVTVYDLIGWRFPRLLSWRGRIFYRAAMNMAVHTATALITISESARADLNHVYQLAPGRLAVTPLAAERRFAPQPPAVVTAMRAHYALPSSYVLYLGSNKPHKNLERLLRAWERVIEVGAAGETALVLAGHQASPQPDLHRFIAERGLAQRVRWLANVADADLPALYSGATVFAFPSYYEGFGLPPLEAMACGTPVLCAYASSLPEVVGEAALTVDPFNVIEMAAGLAQLLRNPGLRDELSRRGQRRARDFSWRRTALETLRIYESVVRA